MVRIKRPTATPGRQLANESQISQTNFCDAVEWPLYRVGMMNSGYFRGLAKGLLSAQSRPWRLHFDLHAIRVKWHHKRLVVPHLVIA
jgi:hypothetical protein